MRYQYDDDDFAGGWRLPNLTRWQRFRRWLRRLNPWRKKSLWETTRLSSKQVAEAWNKMVAEDLANSSGLSPFERGITYVPLKSDTPLVFPQTVTGGVYEIDLTVNTEPDKAE